MTDTTISQVRDRLEAALLADDDLAADRIDSLVRYDPDLADALPEVAALDMGTADGLHKELVDHTARVTAKTPARLRVRLAALLHDVGKPATRRIAGRDVTFHAHEAVGADIAASVLGRLGYGDQLVGDVARIVRMSGRFKGCDDWTDSAVRRFDRDAGDVLDDLLDFCAVDVTSRHAWRHAAQAAQVDALRRHVDAVRERDAAAAERPDLDGREVMDLLGVGPGPVVGRVLAALDDARLDAGGPIGRDAAVALVLDRFGP